MASNLPSILELVKVDMPFLDDSDNTRIHIKTLEAMYFLREYIAKTDDQVEDETQWKPLERILLAKLVCMSFLTRKAVQIAGGDSSSEDGAVPDNSFLKKGKADVVEAEFEQLDIRKTATLGIDATSLYNRIAKEACSHAMTLKISLPFCEMIPADMFKPFYFIYC